MLRERPLLRRQQLGERGGVELDAEHRSPLEHRPLVDGQPVDARADQRPDAQRRGQLPREERILGLQREQLLDRERVAAREVRDSRPRLVRQQLPAGELRDQR